MSEELTPWQRYKKNLGETRPWDILNPSTEWASSEVAEERYSICKACPELIKLTNHSKNKDTSSNLSVRKVVTWKRYFGKMIKELFLINIGL